MSRAREQLYYGEESHHEPPVNWIKAILVGLLLAGAFWGFLKLAGLALLWRKE